MKEKKKSPAKAGAYGDTSSPDTKDCSLPFRRGGRRVIAEVKANRCSPEALSSSSSRRGLF